MGAQMRSFTFILAVTLLAACEKQSDNPPPANPEPTATPTDQPPVDGADPKPADRPKLTAAECESQGGKVVGDIGDGAIHRPDYKCESGEPPVGTITPDPGGPVAIEGSVCCK